MASLHDEALQAEKHLEALATGLAQAGAPEGAVNAVTKMASVTRDIVKSLGKGQEQTGDKQPPAPQDKPQGQPVPQSSQEQASPAPDTQQPHTMDSASADLHNDVLRRKGVPPR